MKSGRPRIKVQRTLADTYIEAATIGAGMFALLDIALHWSKLPARVPIHFDGSGQPDGWADRTALLLFPAIVVVVYVGLSLIQLIPHHYNYLISITERNVTRQYTYAVRLVRVMKLLIIAMFTIISAQSVRIALGQMKTLAPWSIYAPLCTLGITLAWYIVGSLRAYAQDKNSSADTINSGGDAP